MRYLQNFIKEDRKPRCECGKVCFDKKTATTKKNYMLKQGNEKYLRVYQCDFGDWWHITSQKYR